MDQDSNLNELNLFFPKSAYTSESYALALAGGELEVDEKSFANTLKGALLDEGIVEVQLPDPEQVFFCRILDYPPSAAEEYEDEQPLEEGEYEKGSYLDNHNSLIITPLEPSMGNHLIALYPEHNNPVLLRIISSNKAIELACYFDGRTTIGDMPVLRLTFPFIAKRTKEAREFRAKVPKDMSFQVTIERIKKKPFSTTPLNISCNGMSLLDPMGRHSNLKAGEKIICELKLPRENAVLVDATVIHVTRLRDTKGIQYCFGVRFMMTKPAVKTSIEKIVALVQRRYLRELSNFEEEFGVLYDKE